MTKEDKKRQRNLRHDLINGARKRAGQFGELGFISTPGQIKRHARSLADQILAHLRNDSENRRLRIRDAQMCDDMNKQQELIAQARQQIIDRDALVDA